jgi:hypothetical protein
MEEVRTHIDALESDLAEKAEYIGWANEGLALLMALMNGRGIVEKTSAERKVYEAWRKRGHLQIP